MNGVDQAKSPISSEEEIDLRALWGVLWEGKWLIGGVTLVATALAIVIVLFLPNVYRAQALLAPNDQEGAGGLSALAAQYGGLASLAGVNLGTNGSNKTVLGLEILKSRKFLTEFIERRGILVQLMAANGWDPTSGELLIDSDDYDVAAEQWVRNVSPPKKVVPSLQEAYLEFRNILIVSQDNKTGFVTVAIDHYSPSIAKLWVDWLIDDLNSSVMRREVDEAEQAIKYLNEQIARTSLAELHNVFFNLIEEQTKTVMLAKVTDEYLLKTLDPAVAPELKFKPKRSRIVILSMLLGSFLAVTIVLVSSSSRRKAIGQ